MRNLLLGSFLFLSIISFAQTRCEVSQYLGTDSAHASVARIITYNSRGQMITEQFIGYKKSEQENTPDGTYTYVYNDTLMTKWLYSSSKGDSSRMEFQYDANGRLIRQSLFEWKMMGNGNVMMTEGQANSIPRRWEQTSLVNFTYDSKGRKILYDATRLHYSPQNMYKWEYDDQNRITKYESYSRGRLTWREDYQYFDWGYRYWRTWFDFEGNMRHEYAQENPQYWPLLFFACKLDKQGRIIEERITDEKQKLQGRTVTYYNSKGKIAKTIYYNAEDKQAVTHIFAYK